MTTEQIKKELYKQKPQAKFQLIRKGAAYYTTIIKITDPNLDYYRTVNFEIPVIDMGEADFTPEMEAQLLNRWILN